MVSPDDPQLAGVTRSGLKVYTTRSLSAFASPMYVSDPVLDATVARVRSMTKAQLAATFDACAVALDKFDAADLRAVADGAAEAESRALWGDALDDWDYT